MADTLLQAMLFEVSRLVIAAPFWLGLTVLHCWLSRHWGRRR